MLLKLRLTADGKVLQAEVGKAATSVKGLGTEAERSGERASQGFGKARQGVESISRSLNQVKNLVGGLFLLNEFEQAGRMLFRLSDEYANLNGQIALVAESAAAQDRIFEQVRSIANDTGQALNGVATLTTRTIRALTSSGEVASEAISKGLRLTDVISNAVLVSGASQAEANAGIIQLSQGLASGVLRGEEFNSVMEQTPRIAIALSDALGVTLGQLRAMAAEGELTTDVVTNALLSQAAAVKAEADSIPPTIGRAWTALVNEVGVFIGKTSEATDAGQTLATAIQGVADNLTTIFEGLIRLVEVLVLLIAARLTSAIAGWVAANISLTASISGTTIAQLRLNGALLAATLQMRAVATAAGLARGALALVGGPVGVAVLAAGAVGMLAMRSRTAEQDMEELEKRVLSLTGRLEELTRVELQRGLDDINAAMVSAADELRRIEGVLEFRAQNNDFVQANPDSAAAKRIAADTAELERQAEAARQRLVALGEQGLVLADRLDQTAESIRNVGTSAEALPNADLIDPLSGQVAKLEEQLLVLTRGEDALLAHREQIALAAAAQQDAADNTTVNTSAVTAYFVEIRRLTGAIDASRKAQEAATRADQDRAAQQRQVQVFEQQAVALQAEIEALRGGEQAWAAYQQSVFEAQQIAQLGPDATEAQIEEIRALSAELFELRGAFDDLGDLDDPIEALIAKFDGLIPPSLIDEIREVEQALEDALNPEQVTDLQQILGALRQQMLQGFVGASQQALSSIQQLARQGSKEYAALEVAIQALNVVSAIGAILNQGTGDPYTAWARMAAMASAVAGLVGSLNANFGGLGGNSDAANQQALQGTATVLGDADAKSESIARATELTAKAASELVGINRGMLRALQTLSDGIAGASGMLARGAGQAKFTMPSVNENVFDNFGPLGSILDLFDPLGIMGAIGKWLGGKSKVTDEGIEILSGTVGELIEGALVGAFADIKYKKWRFGSSKRRSEFELLGDDVAAQFGLIFDAIAEAVLAGATALGMNADEVERAIAEYQVQAQRISLMDLSAEEQQEELLAVFGQIFDGLAGSVAPFIEQFQQVGEGLGETLIRVATGVQVTEEALDRLGFKLATEGPEQFAIASEGLLALVGGVEAFIDQMGRFVSAFESADVRFAAAQDDLSRGLDQVGLQLPETRDGFLELMRSLDAGTASGREQIAMLLELTDAADEYYRQLEAINSERLGLERQLLSLQGDTAALRVLELARLDESNRALQERIWALQDEMAAADAAARGREEMQTAAARAREEQRAAAERMQAELNEVMQGIESTIAALTFSPLRNEATELMRTQSALIAQLNEVGAAEEQIGRARLSYSLQVAELAARLEGSIRSLVDQFTGRPSDFSSPIDDVAERLRDALIDALQGVKEWLRRSSLENPSLTPIQRMGAMQSEFDRLLDLSLNGSGQMRTDAIAALPSLASEIEALGVRLFGSATEPFQALRADLVAAMEQVAGINLPALDPVTGSQVGSIASAVDQAAEAANAQRLIAGQILEEIGALVALNRGTAENIAEQLGVPLADVIETLVGEVNELNLDTVAQLIAVANTLGADLADVAEAIELNIGVLADQESLFSEALEAAILRLPAGIQDQLWDPLRRVWEATSDADANAALDELQAITALLPTEYRDLLAPFFAQIDMSDPLRTQVSLAEELNRLQGEQLARLAGIHEALDRIAGQDTPSRPPGTPRPPGMPRPPRPFAAGGWVSSESIIRAGEAGRELILPNPVSEFLARAGIPINAGSGRSDRQIVERLDRLVEIEAASGQKLEGIAEAQQRTGIEIATGLREVRSAVRDRDLGWARP
jgi:tape measure domain-containing protein